ncbi:hypothetical protein [Sphingobacterium multivorum]|uniref:hypothetical protein n=1 Tax=Sphingobacterium multivorum TaxID=28454 RepID=UPI003DA6BB7E
MEIRTKEKYGMKILPMTLMRFLCVCLIIFGFFSCNKKQPANKVDWSELFKEYSAPKDSLKLQALNFLKANMADLTSEKIVYFDRNSGVPVELDFSDFQSDSLFKQYLEENNIDHKSVYIKDREIISNDYLKKRIENAFSVWKKYPWNSEVSFDNFLDYLLPYKVMDEYPDDWTSTLHTKFSSDISKYSNAYNTGPDSVKKLYRQANELYYAFNVNRIGEYFNYSAQPAYLSNRAGFNEIALLKDGDCYGGAYLGVYYLRSIGIPATVDYVQYWGSKNGSHATEVFINELGKMTTASGRGLSGAAKVFRLSFRQKNLWKDSIAPFVEPENFTLKNLKNNHWSDVTEFHTTVKDINLSIKDGLKYIHKYGYICVFNYGEWLPIFWAKANENRTYTFKKMGYPMLYRTAVPIGDSFKLIGPTYMIDSLGQIKVNKPENTFVNIVCQKINTGEESWVRKGKQYDLFVLDELSGWNRRSTSMCLKDSLLSFENVPKKAIYRLIPRGDLRELSRPFTYEKNRQVWW